MSITKSDSPATQVPWEQFFSHAPIAMGVLSRNGEDARFQQANAASAAQLGLQPSEMAGRSALELGIPPALVQGWLMSLDAARQLQAPLDVRWQLSTQHGLRTFTTRVLAFGEREDPDQKFGYMSQDWTASDDIQVGDHAERERLAGALASALAEEIETPLEQLLGLIGIVSDEVNTLADVAPELELEECGRVLATATLLARKAHRPVRELSEFLRPTSYAPGPVDAAATMRSAVRLVGSEVKRSVGLKVDPLPGVLVQADEARLKHALVRVLLETARGPGVSFARVGDLVVSMNMDDRQMELVILRTDRCPTPQGNFGGCEELVRDAGGELIVEPWVGTGFRVRIRLPLLRLGS
jgi:signal transduction histidine kinase